MLTVSVAFLGFQMHDYEPRREQLKERSLAYLTLAGKEEWISHFDCMYKMMCYVLLLTPLVLVAPKLGIAAFFSSGVVKILAFLTYFDHTDLVGSLKNEQFLGMMVISAGLFSVCCPAKRRQK
mgnify:CR=1 FL=1